MQSKTSCSKFSLFRRCLARYWPLWLVMAAVLVFYLVFPVGNQLSDAARYNHLLPAALRDLARDHVCELTEWTALYAFFFSLGAAMTVFEHTYSTKLSGLFGSLPVRREKVFCQHGLAGLCMLLTAGLLTALVLLGVEAVYGAADPASAFSWLGVYALECLAFYGIAIFCVMLTGHVLVIPALYLLVNFAASLVNILLDGLMGYYIYGLLGGAEQFFWLHSLSPLVKLMGRVSAEYGGTNGYATGILGWGWLALYAAVGVVLAAVALLLFKRRQLECAQDTTAFPILRPILKTIVTIFFALGFPFLVLFFIDGWQVYGYGTSTRFFPAHLLLTVLGAVIGWFLSEMIIQKSLRVFSLKKWGGALLVGALCCCAVCLFRFDAFGVAERIPAPEKVKTATVYVGEMEFTVSTTEGIEAVEAMHRELVDGRVLSEEAFDDEHGLGGTYVNLAYLLPSGDVIRRNYFAPEGPLLDCLEDTLNDPAVAFARRELRPEITVDAKHVGGGWIYSTGDADWSIELTAAEALTLYKEAIRPDIEAGAYSKVDLHMQEDGYWYAHYPVQITFDVQNDDGTWVNLYYTPTADTVNTNAWLLAHDCPLIPTTEDAG